MNKVFFFIIFSSLLLWAQDDDFGNKFVERQIEKAREVAEETKDVLVVAENNDRAILVFCNGNFKGVKLHTRKRNFGMNIKGMDFLLFDKIRGQEITPKKPQRFRSFFASANAIKARKGYFQSFTTIVYSGAQFFKEFVLRRGRRRKTSRKDFVDLRIFDFRDKPDDKK